MPIAGACQRNIHKINDMLQTCMTKLGYCLILLQHKGQGLRVQQLYAQLRAVYVYLSCNIEMGSLACNTNVALTFKPRLDSV